MKPPKWNSWQNRFLRYRVVTPLETLADALRRLAFLLERWLGCDEGSC